MWNAISPGFELVSPCPIPATITITPRALPRNWIYKPKLIQMNACVIYWPSAEPSFKRCTCVNKWKNSGSRWTLENNITRCPGGSSQSVTGCQSESQLLIEGFGNVVIPGWATQAKMRKKCCYGREKNLGQYSSPSLSPLISHTQQTSPFRK